MARSATATATTARRRIPYRADRINPLYSFMLRTKRLELGLTEQQMADRVVCHRSTIIYNEEEGRRAFFPRPDLAHAIADGYELSIDDLLEAAFWTDMRGV